MVIANRLLLRFVTFMLNVILVLGLPCIVLLMVDYIGRGLHTWEKWFVMFYNYNQARKNCTCGAMRALLDKKEGE